MNPYESGLDIYQTLPVLLYFYDHVFLGENRCQKAMRITILGHPTCSDARSQASKRLPCDQSSLQAPVLFCDFLRPFPRSYGWNMELFVGFTMGFTQQKWWFPWDLTGSSSPVPPKMAETCWDRFRADLGWFSGRSWPKGRAMFGAIFGWYWWYWNDIFRWFIYVCIYIYIYRYMCIYILLGVFLDYIEYAIEMDCIEHA